MTSPLARPSIAALTEQWREGAEAISRDGYRTAREAIALLPADVSPPGLAEFVGYGMGVVAIVDGSVVGYLAAYPPFDEAFGVSGLRGCFTPVEAFGIADKLPAGTSRADVVARLYTAAAELWTLRGATSHAVSLWAHDAEVTGALFRLGFGMRCIDAVADARALASALPAASAGITISEASGAGLGDIAELSRGLIRHLNASPSFLAHHHQGVGELRQQVAEGSRFLVAHKDGDPIAYVRTSPTGENFVTQGGAMRNVTGAFCVEAQRGTGVMDALLGHVARECVVGGQTMLGVDFETLNPAAERFWLKHFTPYTRSLMRRIDR